MNTLFDMMECYGKPMTRPAAVRNAIGDVAEQFACIALGMERLAIDGRKALCSDALWDGRPVEVKSVGKNGRAFIYKWRLEKELATHGPGYQYVFVRHNCLITEKHGSGITAHFLAHPPTLLITTLGALQTVLAGVQPRKFSLFLTAPDKPLGYHRKGYSDGGWQFGLDAIPLVRESEVVMSWLGHPLRVLCQHA